MYSLTWKSKQIKYQPPSRHDYIILATAVIGKLFNDLNYPQVSLTNKLLIPMYWFKSFWFGRDISKF